MRENPIYKWMITGGSPILGNPHRKVSEDGKCGWWACSPFFLLHVGTIFCRENLPWNFSDHIYHNLRDPEIPMGFPSVSFGNRPTNFHREKKPPPLAYTSGGQVHIGTAAQRLSCVISAMGVTDWNIKNDWNLRNRTTKPPIICIIQHYPTSNLRFSFG